MTYGITGNPTKDAIWTPIADLLPWLHERSAQARLHPELAAGLRERELVDADTLEHLVTHDLAGDADVVLSFGGDGTLLRSAHRIGRSAVPILGVNAGRLGFLTRVDIGEVKDAVAQIEDGEAGVEERMALGVEVEGASPEVPAWAFNDVVVDKSGTASMIAIEAHVDGRFLNTYWADGLIVSTPTGSTAYALSVGGPIVTPAAEVIGVTPIAPHTLTARPIVLPCSSDLTLRVTTRGHPYVLACDGVSSVIETEGVTIRVRRATHGVRLVTLPGRDYFSTIRDKLSWGRSRVF